MSKGITAKLETSQELYDFFVEATGKGKDKASRGEVTKAIWTYAKENDLQDPSDGRVIIADETLKELFGNKKKLKMGDIARGISDHLFKD